MGLLAAVLASRGDRFAGTVYKRPILRVFLGKTITLWSPPRHSSGVLPGKVESDIPVCGKNAATCASTNTRTGGRS